MLFPEVGQLMWLREGESEGRSFKPLLLMTMGRAMPFPSYPRPCISCISVEASTKWMEWMTERVSGLILNFERGSENFPHHVILGNGTCSTQYVPSTRPAVQPVRRPGDPSPNGGINPSISFLCLRSEALLPARARPRAHRVMGTQVATAKLPCQKLLWRTT